MAKPSIKYFLENKLETMLPAKLIPFGMMPVLGPNDTVQARIDYPMAGHQTLTKTLQPTKPTQTTSR